RLKRRPEYDERLETELQVINQMGFPGYFLIVMDYLVKRAKEGLEERLAFLFPDEEERLKRRPEYDERLETELQVINQMGFPGYFLIVM
ncbi:hypothetical protein, partial [Morganella morganii]|uniref:hypothetical protein n=1 Tax=Morganella morganii TaxID=582 RepID=UPI000BDD4601